MQTATQPLDFLGDPRQRLELLREMDEAIDDEHLQALEAELRDRYGKLPPPTEPANPRTRQIYDTPRWTGHEVTLDLYPDVFAYGILLLPKDLKEGEKRPVVVCQHGLEGTPMSTITTDKSDNNWNYYKGFATELCKQGFITYAPQNPYIGKDHFRQLVRKLYPLKKTLWSVIVPLHAGEYPFMYVIDGVEWITPPQAEDFVTDGFGQTNGVVVVR